MTMMTRVIISSDINREPNFISLCVLFILKFGNISLKIVSIRQFSFMVNDLKCAAVHKIKRRTYYRMPETYSKRS